MIDTSTPRRNGKYNAIMTISGIDHAAMPVTDMDAMLAFYRNLGFAIEDSLAPRLYAVVCGRNKINLHAPELWQATGFSLRGPTAVPGCGDFCFVWSGTQEALDQCLDRADADIIEGPVQREGGRGLNGMSTYARDPDGNLLEFIIYEEA